METQIENYIDYLNSVKHASANTIASYRRDLKKMSRFFADRQCTDVRELRGNGFEFVCIGYGKSRHVHSDDIQKHCKYEIVFCYIC